MKTPKPPAHLTAASKKLWREIFEENEMDVAAVLMLNTLCEQFDRMNEAREILKRDGLTVKDRFDQEKQHPAVGIESNAAAAMMRAWKNLGFDQVAPGPMGRPAGS